MSAVPSLTLNNEVEMPAIGLGVFQTPPDDTTAAVAEALRLGYRHIDTAAAYFNEREVGEGLRRAGIPRDVVRRLPRRHVPPQPVAGCPGTKPDIDCGGGF